MAFEINELIDDLGVVVDILTGECKILAIIFMVQVPSLLSVVIGNIQVSAILAGGKSLTSLQVPNLIFGQYYGVNTSLQNMISYSPDIPTIQPYKKVRNFPCQDALSENMSLTNPYPGIQKRFVKMLLGVFHIVKAIRLLALMVKWVMFTVRFLWISSARKPLRLLVLLGGTFRVRFAKRSCSKHGFPVLFFLLFLLLYTPVTYRHIMVSSW